MAPKISTEFSKMFDISIPIATAPMSYATSPALVASAIKAGGIGFLGSGIEPASKLAEMIDQARAELRPGQQTLVGMGLIGWVLDHFNTEDDPRLKTILDRKVSAVWLAFGSDLGQYVTQIREHSKASGHNTKVLVNISTIDELKTAVNEWKVDVVIVKTLPIGAEAGGRNNIHAPSTLEFVKQAIPLVPDHIPILAAGGIMKGSQMVVLLEAGASGIVLGTRVLFTPECIMSEEVAALTMLLIRGFKDGVDPTERKAWIRSGDKDHLIIFAGEGVSEVNEIQPTETVIKIIAEEAAASLKASGSKLG